MIIFSFPSNDKEQFPEIFLGTNTRDINADNEPLESVEVYKTNLL